MRRLLKVSHFYSQLNYAKIQSIHSTDLSARQLQLDIKRDDLLHPIVSGNKWRKLKHLLLEIETRGFSKIAAMGGNYSNLLHSLSYLAMQLGWQAEFYVRAHAKQPLTPMLQDAKRWGAKIHFVNRVEFRQLRQSPPPLAADVFWIAEGGFDKLAIKGSIESLMELSQKYDYLVTASATGTTLAGYCKGIIDLKLSTKLIAIQVLENGDEIASHVAELTNGQGKPRIIDDFAFGGYARQTPELIEFMIQFEQNYHIPLEPVYNGKSFYAVMKMVVQDYFKPASRILLVHSGGLQGNRK